MSVYVAREWDWRDEALCGEVDGDLWFPEKGGSVREAVTVCRACPVRAECVEYAVGSEEFLLGIWGGLVERQLRAERQRLPRRPVAVIIAKADERASRQRQVLANTYQRRLAAERARRAENAEEMAA